MLPVEGTWDFDELPQPSGSRRRRDAGMGPGRVVLIPPDELDRPELARADRDPGTARAQCGLVFAHGDCDLVVDTTARPRRTSQTGSWPCWRRRRDG